MIIQLLEELLDDQIMNMIVLDLAKVGIHRAASILVVYVTVCCRKFMFF